MRIQPHPDRGPPTTAVLRALDTVTNVLAPSHKSRLQAASYTPLAASGQNPRHGTHHGEVCRGCLVLCALDFGLGRSALFERECRFWRPGFYLKLRPYMKPHAGLAPAPLRDSGAHPPADRRRWLCDIVSGLQGHDAYADRAAGCVAGGIKHGHAHTGYMIAAGCCAGPAAAKEETWKAVCLTIPWYQFTPSKVTWRDILKPLSLFGAAVLRGAPKYRVGWRS